MSLMYKNYAALFFVSVSFVLMIGAGYFSLSRIVEKHLYALADEILQGAAASIRSDFKKAEASLSNAALMVTSSMAAEGSAAEIRRCLSMLSENLNSGENELLRYMEVYGSLGEEFFPGLAWEAPKTFRAQDRPWHGAAERAGGNIGYAGPYWDAVSGKPVISLAKVLRGGGVIGLDIDQASLASFVQGLRFPEGGGGLLAGGDFNLLVYPEGTEPSWTEAGPVLSPAQDDTVRRYVALLKRPETGRGRIFSGKTRDSRGRRTALFFAQIYNGWYLGIAIPLSACYRNVRAMTLVLSLLGALALGLLIVHHTQRKQA